MNCCAETSSVLCKPIPVKLRGVSARIWLVGTGDSNKVASTLAGCVGVSSVGTAVDVALEFGNRAIGNTSVTGLAGGFGALSVGSPGIRRIAEMNNAGRC